ncbi:MAG TPA: O-antigen ligase family protein [Luteolibacter sp.]|nr:O-antigen ligase family protein [Luteolibacter sp.]
MARPTLHDPDGVFAKTAGRGVFIAGLVVSGLLFPALVLFGGSLDLINWGPGLCFVGLACLFLLDGDRHSLRGGMWHTVAFLLLLGLLWLRARHSPGVSPASGHSALIGLAAAGFLIGRLAGTAKTRALFIGISLIAAVNAFATVMHLSNPEWNLIYPERTGRGPSGLFPHYSYSAAFCLGTAGLLAFRACNERGWLRAVMVAGAVCAVATIPISPSRGGNLALALMVAAALALLLSRAYLKSRTLLGVWLPAAVAVVLVLIFAASFVPLIDRGNGPFGFYNDGVRMGFWNAAWQIASGHPWLGGGAGSFAWNVYQVLEGLTSDPVMVHNEALQMAAEYGFPALLALTALLLAPVFPAIWRFVNRTDPTCSCLAALGLLAMLFQSNFESIFHHAPGAFVAALITGTVARSIWRTGASAVAPVENVAHIRFLKEFDARVKEQLSAVHPNIAELVDLLTRAEDAQWRRGAYRLSYWSKTGDHESLRRTVEELGVQAREELGRLNESDRTQAAESESTSLPRGWALARNLVLAGVAIPVAMNGLGLSRALAEAWEPLYLPERMTVSDRFERLLRVVEKRQGLGIDRDVLSAGWESLHQYRSIEARERWAVAYRKRIMSAIPSWRTDPGAALQVAEIAGWAGDYDDALRYYNHAIATQGKNESLFMANCFKGQYFHELFLSAEAAGQADRQLYFARHANDAFRNAAEALGGRRLPRAFDFMARECQRFLETDT